MCFGFGFSWVNGMIGDLIVVVLDVNVLVDLDSDMNVAWGCCRLDTFAGCALGFVLP